MKACVLLCLCLCLDFVVHSQAQELLRNADFEQAIGSDNWFCNQCTLEHSSDAQSGRHSVTMKGRTQAWQGPTQRLNVGSQVLSGNSYHFSGYVKLLPNSNNAPQKFQVTMKYTTQDGKSHYKGVGWLDNMTPNSGWKQISADFTIENYGQPITELLLYVDGPSASHNFLSDSFSLTSRGGNTGGNTGNTGNTGTRPKILTTGPWKQQAESKIEVFRKNDLSITVSSSKAYGNVEIKVKQLKHEFGFGTAVDAKNLINNKPYRDWYLANFEWAVFENDMKWDHTQPGHNTYNYDNVEKAMGILLSNNKTVRGHTVHWADGRFQPSWVKNIRDRKQFYDACMARVSNIMTRFKGRLAHWDVVNEMVHFDWMEKLYGSKQIYYDIYKKARQVDPGAKLFLNDFNVVAVSVDTQKFLQQAREFKAAGAPVDALGAQCHFNDITPGSVVWQRLDTLAQAGLPLWMTELDFNHKSNHVRATNLEEILYAGFSHEKVEGILQWGFWEGRHWRGADGALVNGPNMVPNEAGRKWMQLFHEVWRTKQTFSLGAVSAGTTTARSLRAFYGKYDIRVIADGREVAHQEIRLRKSEGAKAITINV